MNSTPSKEIDTDNFFSHHKYDLLIVLIGIFLGLVMDWDMVEIILFVILLSSLLWSISSRILILPAIFFLLIVPILLLLDREERAEELAVYAFYFMAMAVIRAIIEIYSEKDDRIV